MIKDTKGIPKFKWDELLPKLMEYLFEIKALRDQNKMNIMNLIEQTVKYSYDLMNKVVELWDGRSIGYVTFYRNLVE